MLKRIPILILVLVMLLGTVRVCASEDSETVGVRYITITENGFAADSLDGVEAYYNLYDRYYQCSDLVTRYYREVYGAELEYMSGLKVKSGDYYFEEVKGEPKRGDVAFASAAARGKSYQHWAIVKSYTDGVVTLIEQNWRYGTQAGIERQIVWPSSVYTFLTMSDGEKYTFPSFWAQDGVKDALDTGIYDMQSIICYRDSTEVSEFSAMLLNVVELAGVKVQNNFTDDAEELNGLSDDSSEPPTTMEVEASQPDLSGNEEDAANGNPYVETEAQTAQPKPEPLTRSRAAVMVMQTLENMGINLTVDAEALEYTDIDELEPEEAVAMCALIERRIMHAYDGVELRPDGEITIEHAMIIALAAYNYYKSETTERLIVSNGLVVKGCFY